jgi:hypothetical protein
MSRRDIPGKCKFGQACAFQPGLAIVFVLTFSIGFVGLISFSRSVHADPGKSAVECEIW